MYNNFVPVALHPAVQDFSSKGAQPGRDLAGLATAGADGEHVSNIERDVLRRAMPSMVSWQEFILTFMIIFSIYEYPNPYS